jgi:hypothetical protein
MFRYVFTIFSEFKHQIDNLPKKYITTPIFIIYCTKQLNSKFKVFDIYKYKHIKNIII